MLYIYFLIHFAFIFGFGNYLFVIFSFSFIIVNLISFY